VPTVAATVPGFDFENWQGLFAPAATPAAIVNEVSAEVARIAQDKSFSDQLRAQGAGPAPLSPSTFAAFVDAERRKYRELVKVSGAKAN
jgi:tripartite-type tricarboxylate transporter receptor subunit TctC